MTNVIGFNPFRRGRSIRPGISRALPVETDAMPPKETDVVIIGGGISGALCAYHLAEAGLRVTICEKGRIAGEQSSRAMGWVASLGDEPRRLALSSASKHLWNSYNQILGVDTTYRRCGVTILCYSEKEVADLEAWRLKAVEEGDSDALLLRGSELSRRLPLLEHTGAIAGMHQPSDGCIEPDIAASRIAGAVRRRGVTIVEDCAVRTVETSAGVVSEVNTEKGSIRTGSVVVAAGAWSRLFLRNLGLNLPLLSVYSSVFRTDPVESGLAGCGATKDFGWRRHIDGSYSFGNNSAIASLVPDSFRFLKHFLPAFRAGHGSVSVDLDRDFFESLRRPKHWKANEPSPFEQNRILSSAPDMKLANTILSRVIETFPEFGGVKFSEAWGSVIDVTPDRAPVVSPVDAVRGLFLCTGFSAHGLAMAPAAAKLITSMITGVSPRVDAAPYNARRFSKNGALPYQPTKPD